MLKVGLTNDFSDLLLSKLYDVFVSQKTLCALISVVNSVVDTLLFLMFHFSSIVKWNICDKLVNLCSKFCSWFLFFNRFFNCLWSWFFYRVFTVPRVPLIFIHDWNIYDRWMNLCSRFCSLFFNRFFNHFWSWFWYRVSTLLRIPFTILVNYILINW